MAEKKKWYNNSIKEVLILDSEPIPSGFVRGRLPKPKKIDYLKTIVTKEELYKAFIVDNIKLIDLANVFNVSHSDIRILLNYYDIHKDAKLARKNNNFKRTHEQSLLVGKKSSETQKKNWENKSKTEKQIWAKKCKQVWDDLSETKKSAHAAASTQWYTQLSESEKKEVQNKKSITLKNLWKINHDEIVKKQHDTEKLNRQNRKCRSVSEQKMYDMLIKLYPDVQYDIRVDDRYPYYCDFYIPSEDLFIELNAHPSHGRLPYSELLFEEYSKYPIKWVDVFAKRDVEKQQRAKQQKLNYIMIYPSATLEENQRINSYSKLVELLYKSQL